MYLLTRIALSNGNPQRTITALRLLISYLMREREQYLKQSRADSLSGQLQGMVDLQQVPGLGKQGGKCLYQQRQ